MRSPGPGGGGYKTSETPFLQNPWVVVTFDGAAYFMELRLARAYAARELSRGNELEIVIMKVVPIEKMTTTSTPVEIETLDQQSPPDKPVALPSQKQE